MSMVKSDLSDAVMAVLISNDFIETTQNRALANAIADGVVDEVKKATITTVIPGGSSAGTYVATIT